jgi:hypothetical protein
MLMLLTAGLTAGRDHQGSVRTWCVCQTPPLVTCCSHDWVHDFLTAMSALTLT